MDGNYSVTPEKFYNFGGRQGRRISLSCRTDQGENVESGDTFPVNRRLYFAVTGIGGVLDGSDDPKVIWEVCNAGYDKDDKVHDIYYKDKEEGDGKNNFTRDLSYIGTHLLRCYVVNVKKKFKQQIVFAINGEKVEQ